MERYDKLVRDRIPEIVSGEKKNPVWHIAPPDEYQAALFRKLGEEVAELTQGPSLSEGADVLEVLRAIFLLEGWSAEELEAARVDKERDRGGFSRRIILETVS